MAFKLGLSGWVDPNQHLSPKARQIPRFDWSDEIEASGGKDWCRNFPRVCPFCDQTFFGYAPHPWPDSWELDALEPLEALKLGSGHRETCGTMSCIDAATGEFSKWEEGEWARLNARKRERESLDRARAEIDEREAAGRKF